MKPVWNDTDIPLAYLITFRTFGTWLHGDERGSIDRFHNQYKSSRIAPNPKWSEYNKNLANRNPVVLNAEQRNAIEEAIVEVCNYRNWGLKAINVRTNHVHAVVAINLTKPEKALNDFKSYATRKMRRNNCWQSEKSPLSDKGSKRYLWNEQSVGLACDYVVNGQGDELPDF
jgi:REP element-mobilizing transposase RayT